MKKVDLISLCGSVTVTELSYKECAHNVANERFGHAWIVGIYLNSRCARQHQDIEVH